MTLPISGIRRFNVSKATDGEDGDYHKYGMANIAAVEFNRAVSFLLEKGWIRPWPKGARAFSCQSAHDRQ
jgi:hypothetical protein